MKIAIGIIVVLGLGWLLFGAGDATTEPVENAEVMEEGTEGHELGVPAPPGEKAFDLTGAKFKFSQTEIRVVKGDIVTINFESTDGLHDFVVDEFESAAKRVNPGTSTSVTFVVGEVGEFEFYCSVGNHRALGMVGTLIVEEPADETVVSDTAMEEDVSTEEDTEAIE